MTKSTLGNTKVKPPKDIFVKGNLVVSKDQGHGSPRYVVMVSGDKNAITFAGVVVGGEHHIGYYSAGFSTRAFEQYHGSVYLETDE